MSIAEYFEFLPYGKHAFYIWSSYIICFLVLGALTYNSIKMHNKTKNILKIKYLREDN